MNQILIQNGRLIDPSQKLDRIASLLVENGKIAGYDATPRGNETIIDATDKIISPGLIDLYVELREPGYEEDETIETGSAAALAGGFTSIACSSNTDPPLDTQAGVEFVHQKASRARQANVFVIASVSKSRAGQELAEIGTLVEAGAVGFSDAVHPIHNTELLRHALQYCIMFDRPILNRPEVLDLSHGGVMHEGMVSMVLGLPGMPAEAEDVMTGRDLILAESTGGRLHLMSISTAGSTELIRRAKARGVTVTADINPVHFTLTDENLKTFDTNCKINPPLRSREHLDACLAGLMDGTIDCISSGHSPRATEKKMQDLAQAPFGMSSLETTLALVITGLIEPGHLDWTSALKKMTINPANVIGINKGTLSIGADADITIINPHLKWNVDPDAFLSKSSNTPLAGRQLKGKAETVIVGGEIRYQAC